MKNEVKVHVLTLSTKRLERSPSPPWLLSKTAEERTKIVTSLKLAGTGTFFSHFFHFFILLFIYIQTIEMYALKHRMIAQKRKKGCI